MRFAILGPIEVGLPGPYEHPRTTRHMRLIAMLLLAESRSVPPEPLRRALWGDAPPGSADEDLETLVRDWQDWIGHDPLCELRPVRASHQLRITGDELDAQHFRRLAAEAREHVDAERREEALAALDEALALWRGRPVEGLSGPGIDEAVARLLELKAEVDEIRFGIQAHLGRFADIITEARRALEAQPFNEDATRRLMIGLYRTGRAAEARKAYRSLERLLDERSGRLPGADLRLLHTQIRDGDPVASDESRPAPALEMPRQLPAPVPDFTGRTAGLDQLDRSWRRGAGGAVISGVGGVGKTWLGLEWSHRHLRDFPDGQLYADLRGASLDRPTEPLTVLHAFLRALGFDPAALSDDLDQAGSDYRSYAAGRRILVFLDNVYDADQLRPLLTGTGSSFTVATSRTRLRSLNLSGEADSVDLREMTATESVDLLRAVIGPERVDAEPEATAQLADRCGGLPLALRIAADLLRDIDLPQLAGQIESILLESTPIPGEARADLRRVFHLSYRHLSEAEQRLHLMLAPLPGRDFGRGLALALGSRLDDDPRPLLEALVRSHWLRTAAPGRYEAHNLVAAYAEASARDRFDEDDRQLVRDRVIAYFHRLGAEIPLEEFEFLTAAYQSWWDRPHASRLANALCSFAQRGHRPADLVRLGERGAEAARRLGPVDVARHCNLVEVAAYTQGDLAKAVDYGRRALEALRSTQDGDRVGTARANLGGALIERGRLDEARPLLREALAAAIANGAWDGAVTTLLSLARLHRSAGDAAEAESCLTRAGAIDRDRSGSLRAKVIAAHLDDLRGRPGPYEPDGGGR